MFALTFLIAAVPVDTTVWDRIDHINAALKGGKPVDAKIIAEQLGAADALMRDPALDADYQKIRANAFDTDFAQAESLSKRAGPAFTFAYDGDFDRHQISFDYFGSLAAPGSEAAAFFQAYAEVPVVKNGASECLIDFDRAPAKSKKKKANLAAEWKARADKWQEPFFKMAATRLAKCL